jgi:hypothetical protein
VAIITSVPPLNVESAQLIFVPLQAPDLRSTTASKLAEPTTVILCEAAVATKLYHTSSLDVPVDPLHVIEGIDDVALATFPVVAPPHEAPYTVNEVAPEQSSFIGAGGAGVVTQIVKVVVAGTVL